MAAIVSKQAAKIAARTKLTGADFGKKVCIVFTSPDTVTWADGDTLASGIKLPIGTRILCDNFISCADMGTSIVAALGLRNFATGVAVDADGIAAAVDVAAAAVRAIANNGDLVKDGVEYVTTVETELYATLSGGTPTANAQIRFEVAALLP